MQSERVYQLPVSNIAYHVYLAEDDAQHLQHVSQQAFRRTLDTYSEYEALAERFQVELERREAVLKEQREQEKLQRQQERNRHPNGHHHHQHHHYNSHNHHHHHQHLHQRLRTRDSNEHLQLPFSTPAHLSGRGRGRSAQLAAISAEAAAAAEAALAQQQQQQQQQQPRHAASNSSSSWSRHTSPNSTNGIGTRHHAVHAQALASPLSQNTPHIRSSSSDRSFSASPALPPSPSPRLVPMNASDGAAAGFHQHRHQQQDETGKDTAAAGYHTYGTGTGEFSSYSSNGALVSARTQRKKRKQTIPVSQSVVSRIPGITLRLQAEKQGDALQVEILKNVEDYGPSSVASTTFAERSPSSTADEGKKGSSTTAAATPSRSPTTDAFDQQTQARFGHSEDTIMAPAQADEAAPSQTRAASESAMGLDFDEHLVCEEDLRKVRESIESGRRRAYSFLQEAVDAYQDPDEEESDINSPVQHRRGHGLRSGISSRKGGLHSISSVSLQLSRGTMPLADPYSTLLPSAAGSYLPLSWENFSARDCVVNKVTGKHDKDLDELEGVVQEAIARQQQYQQQLLDEQRSQSGGTETPQQQSEQTSGTHGSRHSSPHHYPAKREKHEHHHVPLTMTTRSHDSTVVTRHRRTPSSQNGRNATPPARDSDMHSSLTTGKGANTPRSSRQRQGDAISTRRGANHDGLLHYDDIERILQEKRRKKRIEKQRQSSKASSGNGDDDEHDEDVAMEDVRQMSVESDSTVATRDETMATTTTAMAAEEEEDSRAKAAPVSTGSTNKGVRSKRSMSFSGASNPRNDGELTKNPMIKRERRNSSATNVREYASTSGGERTGRAKRPSDRAGTSTVSSSSSSEAEDDETDLDYKHKSRRLNQPQSRGGLSSSSESQAVAPSSPTVEVSTRRSSRMNTTLPLLELASASGHRDRRPVEANFFDAALEMMSRKRRDVLAKRRAAKRAEEAEAEAAARAAQAAQAELEEKLQAAEAEKQRAVDQEKRLEELRAQKIQSSNLPKSSKILPGRVRRRPPRGVEDAGYLPDACTSCQLSLTELDKTSWKETQETKSIQLPKTWGAHAVLCSACRLQYSIHHTRCTQCFYVPVQEELAASPRCLRCRSGTWLKELLVAPAATTTNAGGGSAAEGGATRPNKKSDRSTSVSRRSSLAGGGTAEEENVDDGAGPSTQD